MAGRPSLYTTEIAAEICRRISNGECLRDICKGDGFPSRDTVYEWRRVHPEFAEWYTKARQDQADTYVDELVALSDAPSESADEVAYRRLQIDTRKWAATRLHPRFYGDKVSHEHAGEGGGPLQVSVSINPVRARDD